MNPGSTVRSWLVTGASGFLGRHLLQALNHSVRPHRLLALVRDQETWSGLDWTRALTSVETVTGGLGESESWWRNTRVEDLGGIFHLAGLVRHTRRDADEVYRVNVEGTLAMVRLAAERNCRLVFASTSGTVGCFRSPGESADEDAPLGEEAVRRWPYYHSKVLAERRARSLADALGVELVIVRPPVLLGPGDHRLRSTAILLRYLRGRLPFVVRGGMHFTDIRDVAQALARLTAVESPRAVYHFPGTICPIQEFFRMARDAARRVRGQESSRATRVPGAPKVIPYLLAWVMATLDDRLGRLTRGKPFGLFPDPSLVEMASRYWSISSRWAEPDLGYRPRPADQTLMDTLSWLTAHAG